MTALLLDPVDVLILRGNRLFGGDVHGEAELPPWPSVVCGAVASRALVDAGRLAEVQEHPERAESILDDVLGPDFRLRLLGLVAKETPCFPLPRDVLVPTSGEKESGEKESGEKEAEPVLLLPREVELRGAASSAVTPWLPALPGSRRKTREGLWITADGLERYLAGGTVRRDDLRRADQLWGAAQRLGIALEPETGTVREGQLYTHDVIALKKDVRLLALFAGKGVPTRGLVRLGGDGRGALLQPADSELTARLGELGRPRSGWPGFRLVLATPGIFPGGWRPPHVDDDLTLRFRSLEARLVAAVVPRPQVISGWDLPRGRPKPAVRAIPAGGVFFFRVERGDTSELEELWEGGLWSRETDGDRARMREGWNRVLFGAWEPED